MVGWMVGWMVGLWQQTYHASGPVNKGFPKGHGRLLGQNRKRHFFQNPLVSIFFVSLRNNLY